MKSITTVVSAFFLTAFLAGCGHTIIGSAGVESPDMKYKMHVEAHGKSVHAYTDYTVKKVGMAIVDRSTHTNSTVFSGWAILQAADLSWKCTWVDTSTVRIDFFEQKGAPETAVTRGYLLIRADSITKQFQVAEHSNNIKLKHRNYFF